MSNLEFNVLLIIFSNEKFENILIFSQRCMHLLFLLINGKKIE
jgi:hypothetical protein